MDQFFLGFRLAFAQAVIVQAWAELSDQSDCKGVFLQWTAFIGLHRDHADGLMLQMVICCQGRMPF